jgi:hypothetical protein
MKTVGDIAGTTDGLVSYTRRNRHRRQLPFDDLDCTDLTKRQRAVLASDWERRMYQEHLAVGAFALLTTELASVGCDPIVLSLVTRASSDEVAHAEVCRRLAEVFGGAPLTGQSRGVPKIPSHACENEAMRIVLHMIEMCCIGETLTTCFFSEVIARTTSEPLREILAFLLEDEIDHGRVGWAHLAGATSTERARVAAVLPTLIEGRIGWLSSAMQRSTRGDEQLEAYGYLMPSTIIDVYRRSLRDVVLPGFHDVGIDIGPAWRRARERDWLP